MKVTPEQLAHLTTAMRAAVKRIPPAADYAARAPSVPRIDRSKDTAKRYRWDLLNAADISAYVCTHLYGTGCNDEHIDTALKAIVKQLEVQP